MILLALFAVIFVVLYALFGGPLPEVPAVRNVFLRFGLALAGGIGCFFLAALLFGSPLAGLAWGVLGWFLPAWVIGAIDSRRLARHHALARDFVTAAAGLYAAGQVTPEVIRTTGDRFAEPFGTEFREMLAQRELNPRFSFPKAFERLAEKYRLPEFRATAAIIAASETAGGPQAAGKGLARLGQALRQRDRLLAERQKSLVEVKIAGYVVIAILLAGLLADATAFRGYFADGAGKVAAGVGSGIAVGLIFMVRKISQSKDLEGVV